MLPAEPSCINFCEPNAEAPVFVEGVSEGFIELCSFAGVGSEGGGTVFREAVGLNLNFFDVPPADGDVSAGARGKM